MDLRKEIRKMFIDEAIRDWDGPFPEETTETIAIPEIGWAIERCRYKEEESNPEGDIVRGFTITKNVWTWDIVNSEDELVGSLQEDGTLMYQEEGMPGWNESRNNFKGNPKQAATWLWLKTQKPKGTPDDEPVQAFENTQISSNPSITKEVYEDIDGWYVEKYYGEEWSGTYYQPGKSVSDVSWVDFNCTIFNNAGQTMGRLFHIVKSPTTKYLPKGSKIMLAYDLARFSSKLTGMQKSIPWPGIDDHNIKRAVQYVYLKTQKPLEQPITEARTKLQTLTLPEDKMWKAKPGYVKGALTGDKYLQWKLYNQYKHVGTVISNGTLGFWNKDRKWVVMQDVDYNNNPLQALRYVYLKLQEPLDENKKIIHPTHKKSASGAEGVLVAKYPEIGNITVYTDNYGAWIFFKPDVIHPIAELYVPPRSKDTDPRVSWEPVLWIHANLFIQGEKTEVIDPTKWIGTNDLPDLKTIARYVYLKTQKPK